MLAGKKKQVSYVVQPRGKPLYEDEQNFGMRMLTKMGWSKNKGLGANENGSLDFIKVRFKDNTNGVGFADRDNQWTEHESQYNNLLRNLGQPESKSAENKNKSMESLEEKSKKSKVRVHYKKFTRGKDISRYSEKDLANIFGKKTLNEKKTQKSNSDSGEDTNSNSPDINDESFGVQTLNSEVSSYDYFKEKFNKIREKSGIEDITGNENDVESMKKSEIENNAEITVNSKKNKKKKKDKKLKIDEISETMVQHLLNEDEQNKSSKKKDKKRKHKQSETTEIVLTVDDINENLAKKKKSKKHKDKEEEDPPASQSIDQTQIPIEINSESTIKATSAYEEIPEDIFGGPINQYIDSRGKLIYTISSYKAEILKNLNLDLFRHSSCCNIIGYGLNDQLELKVIELPTDKEAIKSLWFQSLFNLRDDNYEVGRKQTVNKKKRKVAFKKI